MQRPSEYTKPKNHKYLYACLLIFAILIGIYVISVYGGNNINKINAGPDDISNKALQSYIDRPITNITNTLDMVDPIIASEKQLTVKNNVILNDISNPDFNIINQNTETHPTLTEITKGLSDKDKADAIAKYIHEYVNITGKSSIISSDTGDVINITVYSQEYEPQTGRTKFNLSATKNGKSLLIHNPVRVYGMPYTVQQETTAWVYPKADPTAAAPEKVFFNDTKFYNPFAPVNTTLTPYQTTTVTEIESPTNALLINLAHAFSVVQYGEPTFDSIDPTEVIGSSTSWVAPANVYRANAAIIGGGGGGSSGYVSWVASYACDAGCTGSCNLNGVVTTGSNQGAGGGAGNVTTLTNIRVVPGQGYNITIGTAGGGGTPQSISASRNDRGCTFGSVYTPTGYISTLKGGNGLPTTAFSNTSVGGVGGNLVTYYTAGTDSLTVTPNNTHTGSAGSVISGYTIYGATGSAGSASAGALGGSGYGAGGGSGGAETYAVAVTGAGGAGAQGLVYLEYTTTFPPVASFSPNSSGGKRPTAIGFTDTSSGVPTSWYWNFGDNYNSTLQNPVHVYNTTGTFSVSLTATNAAGSNTATYTGFNISDAPVAHFTQDVSNGTIPLTVTFQDTSTGIPTSWLWTFGDGATSTSENVVHQYTVAGSYNVSLRATNAFGVNTTTKAAAVVANNPASVSWDQAVYAPESTGILSYAITNDYWLPDQYAYVVNIYDQSSPPVIKATQSITNQSDSKSFKFVSSTYPVGYYFGHIIRTKLEVGATAETIGSATMQVAGIVQINGYIRDADTGALINANVSITEPAASLFRNQFAINGYYNTSGTSFLTGYLLSHNVTLSGYRQFVSSFIPSVATVYFVNVTLISNTPVQNSSVSIGGRVLELPYSNPIVGATVYVVNVTYGESIISMTNAYGYYRADNLVAGHLYEIYSIKDGYTASPHVFTMAV